MTTAFPPGAQCFKNSTFDFVLTAKDASAICPTTSDMIAFLNLTDFSNHYLPAYCINPPADDGCPYGYCPNSDIAGPLVRISAYLTNIFVAILIFHQPDALRESFWSQVLTVYSLLVACGISIIQSQLTRIHAILATATAGSPLSLYIAVYAIRSMWDDRNRLAPAVGPGRIIPRLIVLTATGVWIALAIYIILPHHLSHFSQTSCDAVQGSHIVKYFFFLPIVIFLVLPSALLQWVVTLPLQIAILAWVVAIWRKRKVIWPSGQGYALNFWKVWRVVSDNYPFVQFLSVVMIPFIYWCGTIEIAALFSNDYDFSASFGQVLAMFVTVPPMVACVRLTPRFGRWFIDLTWVRFLTCRLNRRGARPAMGVPIQMAAVFEDDMKPFHSSKLDDDRGEYDKVTLLTYDA